MTGYIKYMPQVNVKEKIVKHAEVIFRQQGFDGTSVQDITDAAGVPKGSFYNHFDSKQSLAVEVLHRYSLATDIEDLVKPGDPLDRLRAHFLKQVERTEQTGLAYGCLLGTFSAGATTAGAKVRAEAQDAFAAWTAAVAAVIAEAQTLGEVSSKQSPQDLATYLIDAFEGAVLRIKVTNDPDILPHFLDITFSVLLS
jgi:TetR/AcrR family transcriptional regulator, transcriptional repressor for nem operon